MKKTAFVALILGLFTSTMTPTQSMLRANAEIFGNNFNPDALGVNMIMAETHLLPNSYFVSADYKLYGINTYDRDADRPYDTSRVKYGNMIHRTHDYVALLDGEFIQDIELSQNSRFVVTQSGKVLAAGYNGVGQLGNGTTTGSTNDRLSDVTSFFGELGSDKVIKIAHTGTSTYALTDEGQVFTYGSYMVLGNDTALTYANNTTPINITSFFEGYDRTVDKVIKLQAGLALTEAGVVYGWGGPFAANLVPKVVFDSSSLEAGEKVIEIVATGSGVLLLTSDGRIFGKGQNNSNQLGLDNGGAAIDEFTAFDLSAFTFLSTDNKITSLSFGFAVTEEGNVISWGASTDGMAGNNPEFYSSTIPFTDVTENVTSPLLEGEKIISGFNPQNPNTGAASTLLTSFGRVLGLGGIGTLGLPLDGTNAPLYTPVAINPIKITFTIAATDGVEIGPFYWPQGYRVNWQSLLPATNDPLVVRPGYIFFGFYFDEAMTQNVLDDYNFTAEEDLTLYPKWVANTYTITYQGGPFTTNTNATSISGADLPYTLVAPTKSGSTFVGWYKDGAYTQEVTEITADLFVGTTYLTLYAKFTSGGGGTSNSDGGGSSETGNTPINLGGVILSLAGVAAVGGGVYWFVLSKKTFAELIAATALVGAGIGGFFLALFKKKKDDKTSKKK